MKISLLVFFFGIVYVFSKKVQVLEFADDVLGSSIDDADNLDSGVAPSYVPDGLERLAGYSNKDVPVHLEGDIPNGRYLKDSYRVTRKSPVQERGSAEPGDKAAENVHTLIVDKIEYHTETVYFTHTEVAVVTKCCKQKPHYTKCSSTVPVVTPTSSPAVPETTAGCTPAPGCNMPTTIIISQACNCPNPSVSHTDGCTVVVTLSNCCNPTTTQLSLPESTDQSLLGEKDKGFDSNASGDSDGHSDDDGHDHGHDHTHEEENNSDSKGQIKNHGIIIEKLQKIELACIIVGVISGIWIVI